MPMRPGLRATGKQQSLILAAAKMGDRPWGDAERNRRTWKEPASLPLVAFLSCSLQAEADREPPCLAWRRRSVTAQRRPQPQHHKAQHRS